ncbi:MAG: DUF2124 family protein [Methanomicrobiaceae archaeon]|nr:DUF2124 family protein [Methanomicrobiaceae archaeon]
MKEVENLSGVSGILRPFKKYVEEANLPKNSQIVFYGCPGTCTPFVELIAYAIRSLPVEIVFVPFLNEEKAVTIKIVDNIGAQADKAPEKIDPAITVLMGGLSMENVPVTAEEAKKTVSRYPVKTVGICFVSIFEKEKWTDVIDFDMLIDTPVFAVKVFR